MQRRSRSRSNQRLRLCRPVRDAAGNALTITDAIAARTITSTYDQLNRPLTVSSDADATSTTYTYDFSTPTRSDPSATYTATLDLYGRQTSMTDGLHTSGNIYRWTYAPSGAVATSADPTGNVTTNTYDPLGRLTARSTTGASGCTTCAVYAFAYNRAGNQVTKTSTISGDTTNGTTTYAYDALSRLTTYTPPVAISSGAYTWNAQPDRASIQTGTGTPVTTTFDAAIRPVSDSAGNTYVSNKEGRILAMPGKTLVWDNLGRLTQVRAAPSGTLLATYTYDALDRLRTIAENGTTIRFRYVGLTNTVAQVINNSPATLVSGHATDFTGNELFDFTSGGATQTYLGRNDHGDVTWTAGTTGAVTARAAYDPFGNLVASSGTIPPTRWQGSWQDTVTGLYYVIARWYAPSSGRFLSDDPLAGDVTRPQTRNPYAYVAGNPTGGVDPMGTCVWDTITMSCKEAPAPAPKKPACYITSSNYWACGNKYVPPGPPRGAMTLAEANDFFLQQKGRAELHWDYPKAGCWARAYLVARAIETSTKWSQRGIKPQTAWVYGDLGFDHPTLGYIAWSYHMMAAVRVVQSNGQVRPMVIDAGLGNRPLTIWEWAASAASFRSRLNPPETAVQRITNLAIVSFRQPPPGGKSWYWDRATNPSQRDLPWVGQFGEGSEVVDLDKWSLDALREYAH